MKDSASVRPTESELEILRVLWAHGPSTVRFVNDRLNEPGNGHTHGGGRKSVGYTTTLKLMQLMFEKQLLIRDETSRSHTYSANADEGETQMMLLDRLMESAFGGSAQKMVMQALGNHTTSKKEIAEIRELLDRLEQGEKI